MKVDEIVRFRDEDYRVGLCRTDTSIELVELENGSRGPWVVRYEVHKVSHESEQSESRKYTA